MTAEATLYSAAEYIQPPFITDETAGGLQAAAIILEHIDIVGQGVRGISMVDGLQDPGLWLPEEPFDVVKEKTLHVLSERAVFEESTVAEPRRIPTPGKVGSEIAQDLRAAIIIIKHVDIVGQSVRGIHSVDELIEAGYIRSPLDFRALKSRVTQTLSNMALLEEHVIANDVNPGLQRKKSN